MAQSRGVASGRGVESSDNPGSSKGIGMDDEKYERENDATVLERRRKQISYGKCTPEYQAYMAAVPTTKREPHHPNTPNRKRKYSRRAWDSLIQQWRLNLHLWNLPKE